MPALLPVPVYGTFGFGIGRTVSTAVVDQFVHLPAQQIVGALKAQRPQAGRVDKGTSPFEIESVDSLSRGVQQQPGARLALQQGGNRRLLPAAANPDQDKAEQPEQRMDDQQGAFLPFKGGHLNIHRHRHADPAPDIAHLVPLEAMALQATLLGQHGPHVTQIELAAFHALQRCHFGLALLKGLESLRLPRVGGILRPGRLQAGDMPVYAGTPLLHLLMQLAHHVGRIHQRQLSAGGGLDIPLRDMAEIGIGRSLFRHRHIDAAMRGVPATKGQIVLEIGLGPTLGLMQGMLFDCPEIPNQRPDNNQSPCHSQHQRMALYPLKLHIRTLHI